MESQFGTPNQLRRWVAGTLLCVSLVGCSQDKKTTPSPVASSEAPVVATPCAKIYAHDEVTVVRHTLPELQVTHTVQADETVEEIVDCHAQNATLGRMSLAASAHISSDTQLQPGNKITFYITEPATLHVAKIAAPNSLRQKGFNDTAISKLMMIAEPDASNETNIYVNLPQQAACQTGEAYYVIQPADLTSKDAVGHKLPASEVVSQNLGRPTELDGTNLSVDFHHLHAGEMIHSPLTGVTAQYVAKHPTVGYYQCT